MRRDEVISECAPLLQEVMSWRQRSDPLWDPSGAREAVMSLVVAAGDGIREADVHLMERMRAHRDAIAVELARMNAADAARVAYLHLPTGSGELKVSPPSDDTSSRQLSTPHQERQASPFDLD